MNIFFCFKSDFSHLSLLKYLPASIKSFTSIHFTFYISYWQDFTHIHIICSIYIFEPSLPRQHHGNHTVGYCASYFVFFMNKYVNIIYINIIPLPFFFTVFNMGDHPKINGKIGKKFPNGGGGGGSPIWEKFPHFPVFFCRRPLVCGVQQQHIEYMAYYQAYTLYNVLNSSTRWIIEYRIYTAYHCS